MLRRLVALLFAFPLAVLLVALAVANRHPTRLVLDPFRPEAPVISIELPFYAYLMGMLVLGVLIGGLAMWTGQGHWRKTARLRSREAMRWRAETERLVRENDARLEASRGTADDGARRLVSIAH